MLPVTDDGKILMVRQYRNALDRETLEIPAGKLDDPKEPKIQCAYRELEEETGYRSEHLEYLMSLNTTVAFCDEAIDIFVARDLIPSHQHLDEDEVIEVEAWELKDLLAADLRGQDDGWKNGGGHQYVRGEIRLPLRLFRRKAHRISGGIIQ